MSVVVDGHRRMGLEGSYDCPGAYLETFEIAVFEAGAAIAVAGAAAADAPVAVAAAVDSECSRKPDTAAPILKHEQVGLLLQDQQR